MCTRVYGAASLYTQGNEQVTVGERLQAQLRSRGHEAQLGGQMPGVGGSADTEPQPAQIPPPPQVTPETRDSTATERRQHSQHSREPGMHGHDSLNPEKSRLPRKERARDPTGSSDAQDTAAGRPHAPSDTGEGHRLKSIHGRLRTTMLS